MQYQILGGNLPVVTMNMDEGEQIILESGAMAWMSPNMKMETVTGGAGKVFGRMFSGEHLFQNRYTAEGGPGMIAVNSSFPGEIRAVEISPSNEVVIQKKGYLASQPGVELSVFFQKKFGSGLFGGEGFIMQKLSGNGFAFLEVDGSAVEYTLGAGEQMIVSTGHIAMMSATCSMDVRTVPGVKNALFGGEGLFNTVVTGPGTLLLQTMPVLGMAEALAPYLPSNK